MGKRADGELELDILQILWRTSSPLTTSEVREQLDGNLAYTSVATVLTRLTSKGLASRQQHGRSFMYRAVVSRDDWYATRMVDVLRNARNRPSLLAGFVHRLSKRDRHSLKRLLDTLETDS